MADTKADTKGTEAAELQAAANDHIEKALDTIMQAASGLNAKIDIVTVEQANQKSEIEAIKNTPRKLSPPTLLPLGPPLGNYENDNFGDDQGLPDAHELDAPASRKSTDRRNSYITSSMLSGIEKKTVIPGPVDVGVTVLQVQKNVPAHYQVDVVSIPKLVEAKQNQQVFISENGQNKTLVFFYTTEALKLMIKSEETLSTPLAHFLNLATIYTMTDEDIEIIIARLVRDKYTTTRDALVKTVMGMAPQLKAYSMSWSFSIVGYDRQLHSRVVEWIKKMRQGWELLIQGVTDREKQSWIKERYGSVQNPRMLRVFIDGLGEYGDNFVRLLDEEKLKKMDSVMEFLDALEAVDKKMCAKALQLRREDGPNEAFTPLKDLRHQMVRTPAPVDKFGGGNSDKFGGQSEPRIFRPQEKSPQFGRPNYPSMPSYGSNNHGSAPNSRGYQPRQSALEEVDLDMSYASEPGSAPVMPFAVPGDEDDDDDAEFRFDADLAAMMGRANTAMSSGGKALFDHKAKSPGDPAKPCFAYYRGKCDGKCGGYSHDDVMMEKLAFKQLEDIYVSRFGGRERTQRNLEKIIATTLHVQLNPPQMPASRARVSILTGEPNENPGSLIPIGSAKPSGDDPLDY